METKKKEIAIYKPSIQQRVFNFHARRSFGFDKFVVIYIKSLGHNIMHCT